MNKNRLIYLAFLGFTIYLGIYKDGFVSTMLFYMTLLLPVAALGHLIVTYTQFRLLESLDRNAVVKGDSVAYQYQINNNTKIVFCPMQVKFAESEVLFKDSILSEDDRFVLYPGECKVIKKTVDCKYRGLYYIGIDCIYIYDFMGIFRIKFRVSEHQKILVYPLIRELTMVRFRKTVYEEAESIHSLERESASVFSDIRQYQSGDSIRNIHWKLSAKKNELMTKEFEGSTSSKTTMMLNVDGLPFSYEENIVIQDYIIEGAVAIVKYLLDNNAYVNMISYKTKLNQVTGTGKVGFGAFYDYLAKMMFSQHSFNKNLLEGYYHQFEAQSQMMIFTPFISESFYQFVSKKMLSNNNIIVFIVDPKEKTVRKCFETINLAPLYRLIADGLTVYTINFENGICRLDVA